MFYVKLGKILPLNFFFFFGGRYLDLKKKKPSSHFYLLSRTWASYTNIYTYGIDR